MPWHGKAFYLPLQQPPGPGYLRTYRNFQTPGQRQHYGRYDKKTPGTREYLAIVKGDLTPPTGTITAPLSRKEGSIIERTVDFDHGEEAITHYKLVKKENGHSLVSLQLETGRTHQIRIHMKYLGYPLIGDYLYNPDMEHITRQALHSYHMEFPHPITGQKMTFTAPLPSDMSAISPL